MSCNIKRSKTTAKLSENSWNKRRSKRFHRRHLWRQWLYCYPFLSVAQHESGTRKAIFWSVTVYNKKIFISLSKQFLRQWKLYINLFSTGSIWAVKFHWLINIFLLYTVTDQNIAFLVPDSCWATERNGIYFHEL
jgi:hypothetical protein